jgi:arylsulfatase A-like enzyme
MTKERYIRKILISLLCFGFLGIALKSHAQTNPDKPNIILIMADDLGWGDVGFNGNHYIKTPTLDEMAKNGIQMNRFYAASAVCSPTRGSALTGRHPERYGITHANVGHIKKEEITLAEALKGQGYSTGHFGKWHLGTLTTKEPDANRGGAEALNDYSPPWINGFDVCFSTESKVPTWNPTVTPDESAGDIGSRTPGEHFGTYYWTGEDRKATDNLDGDDSRVIMDRVIPFIKEAAEQDTPFFTVIWFHTPHLPVLAGPEHRALYPDLSEDKQHYFGSITAMDEQIGRLRETLRNLGVADDTMIWFCSDNGPEGQEQANRTQGSAGPFKGRKRSLYEGGIRVPAVLEWPAQIQEGKKTNLPASTNDYFPTILGILGFENEGQVHPLDGANIFPFLINDSEKRADPISFKFQKQEAIMDNQFKLYSADGGQTYELYDLVDDPGERNNISANHPAKVNDLSLKLKNWLISCEESNSGGDY